jgi:hypothetical protein
MLAEEASQTISRALHPWGNRMGSSKTTSLFCCVTLLVWLGAAVHGQSSGGASPQQTLPAASKQDSGKSATAGVPVLPRGKKLVLKDGSFQLVRDYARNGERVRYLSAERGDWEELPSAMVDWDATARAEAEEKNEEDALAKKVRAREQAQNLDPVVDVDASLQVAPGVFLPGGEGMFLVDGKSVRLLEQVGSQIKTDKKQFLKQVLSPIPIVPGKQNVQIPGARAKTRMTNTRAEFYLREAPEDPDRTTPIVKSSRPGESGPEVELVRATVKGDKRVLESIKNLFGEELETKRATISMERWDVAANVYRFTLSETLPPGEYALAEILPDGMNLFVWDFGVDAATGTKTASSKEKN